VFFFLACPSPRRNALKPVPGGSAPPILDRAFLWDGPRARGLATRLESGGCSALTRPWQSCARRAPSGCDPRSSPPMSRCRGIALRGVLGTKTRFAPPNAGDAADPPRSALRADRRLQNLQNSVSLCRCATGGPRFSRHDPSAPASASARRSRLASVANRGRRSCCCGATGLHRRQTMGPCPTLGRWGVFFLVAPHGLSSQRWLLVVALISGARGRTVGRTLGERWRIPPPDCLIPRRLTRWASQCIHHGSVPAGIAARADRRVAAIVLTAVCARPIGCSAKGVASANGFGPFVWCGF